MPLDGLPDPTTLICQVCRAEFQLNEARVIRALSTARPEQQETAHLCWICAHLKHGAIKEGHEAKEMMA
jgi:hypothetical protein